MRRGAPVIDSCACAPIQGEEGSDAWGDEAQDGNTLETTFEFGECSEYPCKVRAKNVIA